MGGRHTHAIGRKYVEDLRILEQLAVLRKQNASIVARFDALAMQMNNLGIESFEELEKCEKELVNVLIELAFQTPSIKTEGRSFGFFGITSTGKSTMINKLIGKAVAEVGAGETTIKIESYDGQGYRLYDIPGRNDEMSYFTMEYISFWKGLTGRLILVTATVKEMTKVMRLLDAINLKYDIVVNKFDTVPSEEREKFKAKIQDEVNQCKLKGVNHIWYVSSKNPKQFPDWIKMVDYLTSI